MSIDKFEIDVNHDSCVNKNGKWFFATLDSVIKLIVSGREMYLFLKADEKYNGVWIDCRNTDGKKQWMLIDCSVDPTIYEDDKDRRIEYRTDPPDLTVRPSAHAIYYKDKEIYVTEATIEWVLFADGRIYIVTNEYKTHCNIHCIDTEGKYLWTVEPFDADGSFYSSVTCRGGHIWANSTASYDCRIDPETGRITDRIFGK